MPPNGVSEVKATAVRKPRYFYGWNIVGASFLAQISYSEHYNTILGLFIKPLQNEFGWGRGAVAAVHSIGQVTGALFAPIVGPLVDRYGPRVLMPIGAIIISLAMLGVTQMTAIWQFYLLRGILSSIGFTLMGALVTNVAINNWFIRKRGRALAISRLGGNVSTITFIPVTVFTIAAYGWRVMFVIFAIVTWLVVLIPSAIFMRRRPEDMGLYPDGVKPSATETGSPEPKQVSPDSEGSLPLEPVWSRREVLMSGTFWLLTVIFAVEGLAFGGTNISLAPYIQDLGYSEAMVAAAMLFRVIIAAVATPLTGLLAEQAHKVIIRVSPFVILGVGVFFLVSAEEPVFLWLALGLSGLGFAAVGLLQEVLWADYFGRLSLGLVRSLGHFVAFGFGASGPIVTNVVFDIFGSYRPAFMAFVVFYAIAGFLVAVLRPPKPRRYATAAEMMPSSKK